jgi:hypothetical protein
MTISMSAIWDESIALVKRERQLLVPLALATIGIGSAASALVQPGSVQTDTAALAFVATLAANLLNLIGSLAIIALVLKPGLSVAEGLRLALARVPKMLAIVFLYFLAILVVLLPAILAANPAALTAKTALEDIPSLAMLLGVIAAFVIIYAGLRLVTLNVIIIDRNPPVWTAIMAALAQSRGLVLKLLAVLLLFLTVGAILSGAVVAVLGALFGLLGKSFGLPLLGKMVAALAGGMIEALLSMIFAVFITTLYQKLSAN